MLKKRGQLTIFIIIAVLIGAGAAGYFLVKGNLKIPGKSVSPETAQIQNFVQECLDEGLESVVFQVGENGGYYFSGSAPAKTELLEVPYYIKNNKNFMPSKEKIQEEISKYAARELVLCSGDFASFPEYEITKGKITAETTIEPEKVLVEIKYPMTIIRGETKSKIEDFESEVPVRFGIVYDAAAEFINQELAISEGECISCLADITKKDLYISTFPLDDKTTIFIITDFNSRINKKEFVYIFANEK